MIYIIKHRRYDNPIPEGYTELGVGELSTRDTEYMNCLNPYLNEATGLYDICHYFKDDIVGLVHYRRFFINDGDYLKMDDAEAILKEYDMIITEDVGFDMTLYEQLYHQVEPTPVLDKYLNKIYEKEPDFKEYLNRHSFNNREMFVCKRELISKYCDWLFDLMVPITIDFIRDDYVKAMNKRLMGHIIERLFAYWIDKKGLKTYRMEYIDV